MYRTVFFVGCYRRHPSLFTKNLMMTYCLANIYAILPNVAVRFAMAVFNNIIFNVVQSTKRGKFQSLSTAQKF